MPPKLDTLKSKMKKLGRKTAVNAADNITKIKNSNDYLPGG